MCFARTSLREHISDVHHAHVITGWHRNQGILLAKGPGIKPGSQVYGSRLLDIAPTILHAFGLPVGNDMEGRVLTELFQESIPIQTIPTWENPDGSSRSRGSLTREESQALLEQFVALGYIDEISDNPSQAANETKRENKWNLARAYLYSGKNDGALPLLEDCFNAYPERTDYAQALAKTQFALGLTDEAEETLEICLETFGESISAHVLKAQISIEKGNHAKALEHLDTIREQAGEEVPVLELSCRAYATLGMWDEARATAEKLLTIDPTSIQAHNTRTRCHLNDKDPQSAVDTALAAISFQFASPRAHHLLGSALIQLEQFEEAEHALKNCLQLDRENASALATLKKVYQVTEQTEKAEALETDLVRQKVIRAAEREKHLTSLRHGIAARAKARHAKREASAKKAAEEAAIKPCSFTIVSGLPRSGTSLMMQMLRAAGMDLMHDGKREADEDNLEGYWEWEEIKSLKKNPRLIEQADGKVIKVISALLPQLPPRHQYRVIFMKRPVQEVVDSQWKMIERRGQNPVSEKQHLIQTQQTHAEQTLAQLKQRKNVDLIEINYPEMVANPASQLDTLKSFLGETAPEPEKLAQAIRPDLHRNKAS